MRRQHQQRGTVDRNQNRNSRGDRTAELNILPEDPVSTKAVKHELHKSNIHGRAAIAKPVIKVILIFVNDGVTTIKPRHQTTGKACIIWSNESSIAPFPTSGRVYVWRTPKETYHPECLVPTVKHRVGSVMVWAAISQYSILLVPLLPFMAKLLQGSTWTGWVMRCIPQSRRYFQTTM
jgi:hypothetical protein